MCNDGGIISRWGSSPLLTQPFINIDVDYKSIVSLPICSMVLVYYGIFTYMWVILFGQVLVIKYSSTMGCIWAITVTIWLFNIAMENHHAINR